MNAKKLTKNIQLSAEEMALERELEAGEWVNASAKLKRKIVTDAKDNVGKKNREARVNIRMTEETLLLIQNLAEKEGVGYQTLMGSVLHKYAHGRFVTMDDVKKVVTSLGMKKIGSR